MYSAYLLLYIEAWYFELNVISCFSLNLESNGGTSSYYLNDDSKIYFHLVLVVFKYLKAGMPFNTLNFHTFKYTYLFHRFVSKSYVDIFYWMKLSIIVNACFVGLPVNWNVFKHRNALYTLMDNFVLVSPPIPHLIVQCAV